MSGFYRRDLSSGEIIGPAQSLHTPSGIYVVADKDSYTYPIDDAWRWYETAEQAAAYLSVPDSVTPLQARLALLQMGLLAQVESAVQAAEEASPQTRIAWEYTLEIRRASPFIAAIGPSLGLSDSQIDDIFRLAATL